ncbi:hypothetical protein K457DRAFT_17134 [Linnemannia elongata AG-77]|uniref:Uncharacterized protein n=1 Tax=Linnemannia elongata AG-77 TaxID=1314771 RepID=A0A197K2W9_9FUNG|nr:hypothetical protein K457DRAFT_17134 [Linnemannia elongata AG-77]
MALVAATLFCLAAGVISSASASVFVSVSVNKQGCQFFQLSHEYRIASGTIGPMVFRYREALSPVLGYLRSTLRPLRPDAHAHDLETINPARKDPTTTTDSRRARNSNISQIIQNLEASSHQGYNKVKKRNRYVNKNWERFWNMLAIHGTFNAGFLGVDPDDPLREEGV